MMGVRRAAWILGYLLWGPDIRPTVFSLFESEFLFESKSEFEFELKFKMMRLYFMVSR